MNTPRIAVLIPCHDEDVAVGTVVRELRVTLAD